MLCIICGLPSLKRLIYAAVQCKQRQQPCQQPSLSLCLFLVQKIIQKPWACQQHAHRIENTWCLAFEKLDKFNYEIRLFGKENPEGEEIGFRFMNHGPNTQNSSEILWMIRDHFESSSAPAECQNVIQQGPLVERISNCCCSASKRISWIWHEFPVLQLHMDHIYRWHEAYGMRKCKNM